MRVLAKRPGHWIVTVWPSRNHRAENGYAIRVSDSCLSSGHIISISDANSNEYEYLPYITSSIELTQTLSLDANPVSISCYFDARNGRYIADIDWTDAYGEIAWVDESSDLDGIEQTWETRDIWIEGDVLHMSWGSSDEQIEFTISPPSLSDVGGIYPDSMILGVDRFADVSGELNASLSDGVRPPIPIASSRSYESQSWDFSAPLIVVIDEIDTDSGATDYVPRTCLISYEPIVATSGYQYVYDPDDTSLVRYRFSRLPVSIVSAQDTLGDSYAYIVPDMSLRLSVGRESGGVTVTRTYTWYPATSPTVEYTASAANLGDFDLLRPGDYLQNTDDSSDLSTFTKVKATNSNNSIELEENYLGVDASGTAYVCPVFPQTLYSSSLLLHSTAGRGGVIGPRGSALRSPSDVMEWLLRRSELPYSIDYDSLRSCYSIVDTMSVCTLISDQSSPLDYLSGHLSWVPIQMYLDRGVIRFRYTGWTGNDDYITSIDLTDHTSGVERIERISWESTDTFDAVTLSYAWSWLKERYQRTVTVDGSIGNQLLESGRHRDSPRRGNLSIETDTIHDDITGHLAACHAMYQVSSRRQRTRVMTQPYWRWLTLGDKIKLTETGVTASSQIWLIDSVTRQSDGTSIYGLVSTIT